LKKCHVFSLSIVNPINRFSETFCSPLMEISEMGELHFTDDYEDYEKMDLCNKNRMDIAVITVNDTFFESGCPEMRLTAVMGPYNKMVFDMHMVKRFDTVRCGILLGCLKRVKGSGGDLKLCRVLRPVQTMLELVRIQGIIEIFETRQEAVGSFSNQTDSMPGKCCRKL